MHLLKVRRTLIAPFGRSTYCSPHTAGRRVYQQVSFRPSIESNEDANGDGKRHSYLDEFVELLNPSVDAISLAE